jgi:hypothetical protein
VIKLIFIVKLIFLLDLSLVTRGKGGDFVAGLDRVGFVWMAVR